ncbi:MAG: phage antirepressor, partial [Lachnospiraceae bacterium]|nr:phage antirepressor [Lachnospiraceae bacterium]
MSELQVFNNAEFGSVRSLTVNGEPYFVGKDVAEALGYSDLNKAIAMHVDEEDKLNDKTSSSLGQRGGWLINESGLYSLILSSKLPSAKRFKRWVTSEVLPAIRKHGVFAMDDIVNNTDALIEALQAFKAERLARIEAEAQSAVKSQQIAEMQPKVSYYNIVLQTPDVVPITVIAKDYGWSGKRMNKYLHEEGIQFREPNGIWLLYQKYADKGYTKTKTSTYEDSVGIEHSAVHTYWTQEGRLFIYDLLKSRGILPL